MGGEAKARFTAAMRHAEDLFERADQLIETSRRTAHDARNHRLAAVMTRAIAALQRRPGK